MTNEVEHLLKKHLEKYAEFAEITNTDSYNLIALARDEIHTLCSLIKGSRPIVREWEPKTRPQTYWKDSWLRTANAFVPEEG